MLCMCFICAGERKKIRLSGFLELLPLCAICVAIVRQIQQDYKNSHSFRSSKKTQANFKSLWRIHDTKKNKMYKLASRAMLCAVAHNTECIWRVHVIHWNPQAPHRPLLHRSEGIIYHDIITKYNTQFLRRLRIHMIHTKTIQNIQQTLQSWYKFLVNIIHFIAGHTWYFQISTTSVSFSWRIFNDFSASPGGAAASHKIFRYYTMIL